MVLEFVLGEGLAIPHFTHGLVTKYGAPENPTVFEI
jgi:hypothetical protein